jgi:hypothetical protein
MQDCREQESCLNELKKALVMQVSSGVTTRFPQPTRTIQYVGSKGWWGVFQRRLDMARHVFQRWCEAEHAGLK